MKNKITMILCFISVVQGFSQNVLSLEEDNLYNLGVTGNYYKDTHNEMDYFVGTWLYVEGTTQFRVILRKETRIEFNGSYQDMLVGEYQYIEDGIEKVNTLNQINQRQGRNHIIYGNDIRYSCWYLTAKNCVDGQPRFGLNFKDPAFENPLARLHLHKRENYRGPDQIQAFLMFSYIGGLLANETIPEINLPWQKDYVFTRQ